MATWTDRLGARTKLAVGLAASVLVTGCGSAYSQDELLNAQGAAPGAVAQGSEIPGEAGERTVGEGIGPDSGARARGSAEGGVAGSDGSGAEAPSAKSRSLGGTERSAPTGTGAGPAVAGPAGAPAVQGCTKQGAPLVIGQVGEWSGVAGQSSGNGRTGLAVWANDVNARGGVACHPVKLTSIDTQSNGSKTSAAVNDLVGKKKAQVLVGSFVPIAVAAYKSAVEENRVPTIGGDYVSEAWLQSPFLFPVGGGPEAVYTAMMKGAVRLGKMNMAILYCVEAAACSYGSSIAQKNAGRAGVKVVYTTSVSLTQSDFTSQCQNARSEGADSIFYFGDGASVQRLARSCNNLGYNPTILVPSVAAIPSLRTDDNVNKGGLVSGATVFPWMLSNTPAKQAFQEAYKRYAPGVPTDAAGALGWTSGKMLEAVVEAIGPEAREKPITAAMIMRGLGKIKNETLGGLIPPTTFTPNQAHTTAVPCAYVAVMTKQTWNPPLTG